MIDLELLFDEKMREVYNVNLSKVQSIHFEDPGRSYLSCEDVIDAHFLICDFFYRRGENLGGFGPKDLNLSASAVARQSASAGGAYVYTDIFDIAATLMFGLINNHPFHDANKRTAFLCVVFLLMENSQTPSVDVVEIEDFTVEIASHHAKNGHHMEVGNISNSLKRMFRREDCRMNYIIKFRELENILKIHGFSISSPSRNYINVYKGENRVAKVGYPGPHSDVTRSAMSTIRKSCGLTREIGVDAQVFFKGADPLSKLIGEYEAPLRRLAER
jgi:death-on-curing family protein